MIRSFPESSAFTLIELLGGDSHHRHPHRPPAPCRPEGAARPPHRMQSAANNLKQIAARRPHYHDANKCLPPGGLVSQFSKNSPSGINGVGPEQYFPPNPSSGYPNLFYKDVPQFPGVPATPTSSRATSITPSSPPPSRTRITPAVPGLGPVPLRLRRRRWAYNYPPHDSQAGKSATRAARACSAAA